MNLTFYLVFLFQFDHEDIAIGRQYEQCSYIDIYKWKNVKQTNKTLAIKVTLLSCLSSKKKLAERIIRLLILLIQSRTSTICVKKIYT